MENVEVTSGVLVAGTGLPQEIASFQKNSNVSFRGWFEKLPRQNLLRYLFQFLGKILPWACPPRPVETLSSCEQPALTLDRPVRHAKKRLGVLVRCLLAFFPSWIQRLLGHLPMEALGGNSTPQETLESPVNPSGKGSKRKQDDLVLEDHRCWLEVLQQQELPEEDSEEDPSYEPSNSSDSDSNADSEEYKSQNDTDLEFEEKDRMAMLKENPDQWEALSGDDKLGESQAGASEEKDPTFQTLGDGSEHPTNQALESSGGKSVTLKDQAEKNEKDAQTREVLVRSVPGTADMTTSTDSQEQWVEVSDGREWDSEASNRKQKTGVAGSGGGDVDVAMDVARSQMGALSSSYTARMDVAETNLTDNLAGCPDLPTNLQTADSVAYAWHSDQGCGHYEDN